MILVATLAALGTAGFVYPADRTVVGELWSQDG